MDAPFHSRPLRGRASPKPCAPSKVAQSHGLPAPHHPLLGPGVTTGRLGSILSALCLRRRLVARDSAAVAEQRQQVCTHRNRRELKDNRQQDLETGTTYPDAQPKRNQHQRNAECHRLAKRMPPAVNIRQAHQPDPTKQNEERTGKEERGNEDIEKEVHVERCLKWNLTVWRESVGKVFME